MITPAYSLSATERVLPSLALNFLTGTLDPRITFTRSTTATFVGSNGLIQSAAIDAPRFDYTPVTLAPKGLLIEEQRTNLVTYSQQFAFWILTEVTVASSSTIAPDGAPSNSSVIESTATSLHRIRNLATVTNGTPCSLSVFARANGSRRLYFNMNAVGGAGALFDLTGNGSVVDLSGTAANKAASIEAFGNGWYRCNVIGTGTGAASVVLLQINQSSSTTAADETYTGDGTSGVLLYGLQLEAGAFPTSYIPTVASQVTRSQDIATMTGTNFSSWYNQTQGTLFVEATIPTDVDSSVGNFYLAASDGTLANQIVLADVSGTVGQIQTGGVLQFNNKVGAEPTGVLKAAIAFQTNNTIICVDGTLGTLNTSVTLPTVNRLLIGIRGDSQVTSLLNGNIRRIAYYNIRLLNAQLQALTV